MQNDRYLILLYGATMIDEFKQWGTKHRKLLYFSYNQLKDISNHPILTRPPAGHPVRFESTRTARNKVYPYWQKKGYVRIEKIHFESGGYGDGVAITGKGIDVAKKRLHEICNGFSNQMPEQQLLAQQEERSHDTKLEKDLYQNYGLNSLSIDYFKSHSNTQKAFDEWKNGFPFDLPSIKAKRELRREGLIAEIKTKLENEGSLLIVGQSGSSKSTILMELMCDYFDAEYDVLYNYGMTDIRNEDGLVRFIEYLLENGKKVLVAVDNGHEEKMSSIFYVIDKLFTSTLTRNLRFIITARIPEFELLTSDSLGKVQEEIRRSIRKITSNPNTKYRLPYFTKEEIKQFIKLYFKVNDNDKFDRQAEGIYVYTKGDPIMVKFSVFGQGLDQDVKEMYHRYLKSKLKLKTMMICSLLDMSSIQITDTILKRCGILEGAYSLEGATLSQNDDGLWKTKHPRWNEELFKFLYNEEIKAIVRSREQILLDCLIAIYNMKQENITYSVLGTLYNIAGRYFFLDRVDSVFQQSISQMPSYLSDDEKKSSLYGHIADSYFEYTFEYSFTHSIRQQRMLKMMAIAGDRHFSYQNEDDLLDFIASEMQQEGLDPSNEGNLDSYLNTKFM